MIYICIFVLLFIFSLTEDKLNERLFKLSTAATLCLTGFRSPGLGIDTAGGYYEYYQYVSAGVRLSWLEPAWELINRLAIMLGLGYSGVIMISAALTIFPVAYVINRTVNNKCFSFAIYYGMFFVLFSFNLMRQCIAVSFALLAVYYYINGRFLKSALGLVAGLMFHKSVVVIIPLIFFLKLKIRYVDTVMLVAVSYLCGLLLSDDFFVFISGQYAVNFLNTGGYAGFRSSITLPALFSFVFSLFFLFLIRISYDKTQRGPWYLVSLLGVVVMNLTMRLGQGTRIVLYFSQAQMIFFANYINGIENRQNKRIIIMVFLLYLAVNFYRILYSQWNTLCPYNFFWNV